MNPERHLILLESAQDRDVARRIRDLPPRRAETTSNPARVRIIHINDLHNAVLERDKAGRWVSRLPSLSDLLESRREERKASESEAVLFISAGDEMVGTVWDYLIRDHRGEYHIHSAYHFLSVLGVDIAVAGNHDFDNGCGLLRRAIEQDASFPVISANLTEAPDLEDTIRPAAILTVAGARIGFLGLTTMGQQRSSQINRYRISSALEAAQKWIPLLRRHCDAVVAISHLGSTVESTAAEVVEYGDLELARALGRCKPDLIIGGHTHELIQTTANGVPIAQVGCNCRWAGEIDLVITGETTVRLLPMRRLEPDSGNSAFFREHITPFLERHLPTFHSLRPSTNAGACPAGVRLAECKGYSRCSIAAFLTDALLDRLIDQNLQADFVMLDAGTIGTVLPENAEVSVFDLFRLLPYADSVVTLELDSDRITGLIRQNRARARARGEEYREKGYVYFSGNVCWVEDRSGTATQIKISGRELGADTVFTAATTQLAVRLVPTEEPHPYSRALSVESVRDTGLFLRDEIVRYLLGRGRSFVPCRPVRFTVDDQKERGESHETRT